MSAAVSMQTQTAKPQAVSNSKHGGMLLQRKCACGSPTSSLTGSCPECGSRKRLQTKLSIGASNDPLEQEADRVADQVMRSTSNPAINNTPPRIQRLTTHSGGENTSVPTSVDRVLASGGSPLEPALQQDMGQRFGHDFSRVRVHSDAAAEQSARDVNAHAYTVGHNVAFGRGQYAPETQQGRRLLAHELTHVVQQSGSNGIHVGQSGLCQSNGIQRKSISDIDKIHDQILDDFSAETGIPRDEASHHSKEYKIWLADKHAGAEEFETFKLTAKHLEIPAVLRRFERMTLEELYRYRLEYMLSENGAKDPAVIKYLTDLMMGRPLQKCSKEEVKKTDEIAKQVMKDVPAMVDNALKAITRLLSSWVDNKSDLLVKKSKFSGQIACAFISNFNITETNTNLGVTAIRVERRLMQLQKRIAKPVSFSCEPINSKICLGSKGRDAEGFVVNHKEPIHLCFGFRDGGIYSFQQSTIIHELLHLLPGLGDDGGYAAFSTSALTCKPNLQFSAASDVLSNTADSITGFIMHIENTSATDLKVMPF